ncbi:RHS repeat-associated core domain-containing protein, partial [Myceligenerans pegani]
VESELTGTDTDTSLSVQPAEPECEVPDGEDPETWCEGQTGSGATPTVTDEGTLATENIYSADGDRLVRITRTATTSGGTPVVTGVTAYVGGGQELTLTPGQPVATTRYYAFAGQTVAVRTDKGMKSVSSLVADHHGTPLASVPNTDWATQNVIRHHTTPYGAARSADQLPGDHRFLGKTRDASTGYTLVGARWYDEILGRFLSVDPLMDLTDPQQWHGYAYSHNNPVTFSDPTGLREVASDRVNGDSQEQIKASVEHTASGGGWSPTLPPAAPADPWVPVIPVVPDGPSQESTDVARSTLSAYDAAVASGQIHPFMPWYLTAEGWFDVMVTDSVNFWIDTFHAFEDPALFWAWWGGPQAWREEFKLEVSSLVVGAATGGVGFAAKGGIKGIKRLAQGAKGAGKLCSFAGSTPVLMADGSKKPIEDIEVGDEVIATDPTTGEQAAKKVTHVWVHQDDLFEFEVDDELIVTTEDHPFWSVTNQTWEGAQSLDSGELVLGADGGTLRVSRPVDFGAHERGAAYNLAVDGIHTYHVGVDAILVHNHCSKRLAANILATGNWTRLPGEHAHHIVPGGHPGAAPARAVLKRFNIDIDAASNGVFLPGYKSSPNPRGATEHLGYTNTQPYIDMVNQRMGAVTTRRGALQELASIRYDLLAGKRW